MEIAEGDILHIEDFEFPKKGKVEKKNKYLIVLLDVGNAKLLLSLPSSQIYISPEKKKPGCIHYEDQDISIYFFDKDEIIGINGFSFSKDTFIYYAQVFERSPSFLESYFHSGQLALLDKLTKEAMIEVLYCAYKSRLVPERYRPLLEKRLEDLHG